MTTERPAAPPASAEPAPRSPHGGPLRAAIGLSLEADRRTTLLTFVNFGLRPIVPVAILYLVKVVVDAAVAHDNATMIAAAVTVAVVTALTVGTSAYAVELSIRMIESTSAVVDHRLMRLVGTLPGVSDLDNPEVLDRIEVLRQERVYLSEGADAFSLVLGATTRALFTGVILALVAPVLLLLPLLALPALLVTRRGQRRRADAVEAAAGTARLAQHFYRTGSEVRHADELRLFGTGRHITSRYLASAEAADRTVTRAVWRNQLATSASGAVFALGYCAALLLVLRDFSHGAASLGEVVLMLGLVTSISTQLGQAVHFFGFLSQTVASSRRLLWLERYAREAAGRDRGTKAPADRLTDGIRFEGVGLRYPGSDTWALRDIDVHLPAGALVAVVGTNGAGKSTLIKLMAGLYSPSSGRITVDGVDLEELSTQGWHTRTSACFQDFGRFEFVVRESVGVGHLPHVDDEEKVFEAVAAGAAADIVEKLPDGLDTRLGRSFDDGTELSGGQWQRLALGRARMRRSPSLLVLDEPTAAIDPLTEDAVLSSYLEQARQASADARAVTVFASHRLALARRADLIVVVERGGISQLGSHAELMAQPDGLYRDLYERQARAYT
ncbi:ABC transporter ATP-binding protein [Streptomyces sp. NPDC002466]